MITIRRCFVLLTFAATIYGCTNDRPAASDSEKNIALFKRFYREVINEKKLYLIDELVTPDVIDHENYPGLPPAREGIKQFFRYYQSAFPDLHFQIDEILATEDKVIARVTIRGTHQGEFFGVEATGDQIAVTAINIVRFENNRITEHWGVTDNLTMLQQLGALALETQNN